MGGETKLTTGSTARSTTGVSRVGYLDNIRIFLTGLVVLHHFAITYGAPGWWFYVEQPVDGLTGAVLFPFVAINQAYFMGFFFLLSAYLLPGSLKRKGRTQFLSDRMVRLGLPLVVYFFVLNPLVFAISALGSVASSDAFRLALVNDPSELFLGQDPCGLSRSCCF